MASGMKPKQSRDEPLACPFTVLVDSREQRPFSFSKILADAKDQNERGDRAVAVPTAWRGLWAGDYSIDGYDRLIAIERKSPEDLFGTLGARRDAFQREHERLAEIVAAGGYAAVVIESNWTKIVHCPPEHSRLSPKTAYRTSIAWSRRYRVPWITADSRLGAEIWTFRALESFWKDKQKEAAA